MKKGHRLKEEEKHRTKTHKLLETKIDDLLDISKDRKEGETKDVPENDHIFNQRCDNIPDYNIKKVECHSI